MTNFDHFPEKLPSINILSQQRQQQGTDTMYSQDMSYSSFVPQHQTDLYENVTVNSNDNMSLDLYNPPSMDPSQFKRKYSVDVGPFGFNAHPSLMHDQDAYRRSSCSAMSVDNCVQQQQNSIHPPQQTHQLQQMIHHNDYPYFDDELSPLSDDLCTTTSLENDPTIANNDMTINNSKTGKRRLGQHYQQGPNAPHKHVCKYSYCGWSFKRYEHLKRHMLVHTGERPHVCVFPGCGKSFSRSDNFHAHYRTHTKKQSLDNNHPLHHQYQPSANTRRGSKKLNACSTLDLNSVSDLTMTNSPSSASSSSIISNQDLLNGVSSQTFVFNNNKPFDMSYQDLYDQRSFTSDLQDQYSSLTPSQSYLPLEMDSHVEVTSLLNHDQVTPMFATNGLTSTYLQGDYSDFHSAASITPTSPTSPTSFTGASTTTKKQRKQRSTLLKCSTNDGTDSGQQKSHVCPMTQCQRRFKRLEHLKRHMRIHTLERPFACTFPKCHKHFSRSDNLSQHMKTHQNRLGQDKRRSSTTSSTSSPSTSSSSVSPRSVMDDYASPNMINQHYYSSTVDTCSTTDVISSLPSCWTSSESIGC